MEIVSKAATEKDERLQVNSFGRAISSDSRLQSLTVQNIPMNSEKTLKLLKWASIINLLTNLATNIRKVEQINMKERRTLF